MADDAARPSRLGRGLAALMGDVGAETPATDRGRSQRRAAVEFLHPNPRNPRRLFTEDELEGLTVSIRERGVIQPIVVRSRGVDDYEIIAGERRWRASQRAGLHDVPIVVLDVSDSEAMELTIIENVQRADLNALEEASGYQVLAEQYNHSQDDIAKIVGKSRSHIANTLRLLKLPATVKAYIDAGKLTAGHARMLVGQPNADELAVEIISRGLNVRQVEELARQDGSDQAKALKPKRRAAIKDVDTLALEKRLSDTLGLAVTIDHRGKSGELRVVYRTLEQLDDVIMRLESR